MAEVHVYNSISREKEVLQPINPPHVGLYVCGPTVYGDAHLGHARPAITFDIVFRYLSHLGYKVRYVRNITDVGHLENDADQGEDKIARKARLEQLEPMEIVQQYTLAYHRNVLDLNCIPPSIEPRASGHIIEQISMIEQILANGFAYETDGSVYFDVLKYNENHNYGKLSGRIVDELLDNTRDLDGQDEKRNSVDFALWKKASPEHIMRWPSPWSDGFPGWHLECSVMSTKYLGDQFDIHGGGMDLLFPHHECEIAQNVGSRGKEPCKYWMHNNMITINGQKMGKSLGNFITLDDLFSGGNDVLDQAYSPMTIRFFILQAHYRSTLDFSNDALKAAEKGYSRLMDALEALRNLTASDHSSFDVKGLREECFAAMNDDFNTPIAIAKLFDSVKFINSVAAGKETISTDDLDLLRQTYQEFVLDIFGLKPKESKEEDGVDMLDKLMQTLIDLRNSAKEAKDFETADKIRDDLAKINITLKDGKEGTRWDHES